MEASSGQMEAKLGHTMSIRMKSRATAELPPPVAKAESPFGTSSQPISPKMRASQFLREEAVKRSSRDEPSRGTTDEGLRPLCTRDLHGMLTPLRPLTSADAARLFFYEKRNLGLGLGFEFGIGLSLG